MQSRTEWFRAVASAFVCSMAFVGQVAAQVGEVMDSDDQGDAEANDERRAERISARNWGDRDRSEPDDGEGAEDADNDDDDAEGDAAAPMPYRVGADIGIEVGGHMLVNQFTVPSLPALGTGLGFSGRVATTAFAGIVAEANVGIMFNKDSVDDSYRAGSLRIGARYPLDVGANPLLLFIGAGAALEFLSATTAAVGMTVTQLDKSAITPALDLQLGAIYEVADRLAIEAMVQGTYAFSNVVWLNKDASWVALYGGVSYDL